MNGPPLSDEERRRAASVMAKISRTKREVEADPAAAMQTSLDASMAQFKRRMLRTLFWVMLAAIVAFATYFYRDTLRV